VVCEVTSVHLADFPFLEVEVLHDKSDTLGKQKRSLSLKLSDRKSKTAAAAHLLRCRRAGDDVVGGKTKSSSMSAGVV